MVILEIREIRIVLVNSCKLKLMCKHLGERLNMYITSSQVLDIYFLHQEILISMTKVNLNILYYQYITFAARCSQRLDGFYG